MNKIKLRQKSPQNGKIRKSRNCPGSNPQPPVHKPGTLSTEQHGSQLPTSFCFYLIYVPYNKRLREEETKVEPDPNLKIACELIAPVLKYKICGKLLFREI